MDENTDDVHFVEDLEERENASFAVTTLALGEEATTQACVETGCGPYEPIDPGFGFMDHLLELILER